MQPPITLRIGDIGTTSAESASPDIFGQLDSVFKFLDNFMARMQGMEAQFARFRALETQSAPTTAMPDPDIQTAPGYKGVETKVTQLAAKQIDPVAVYGKLLGYISKIEQEKPELTLTELLAMTKSYKDFVIPEIAAILADLQK